MATTDARTLRAERRSLDGLFSQSLLRNPAAPALYVGGKVLSYGELDSLSLTIEHSLCAAGLAGRAANIGVVYDRSAFSYAAVLAVMRTGNVYVPLNAKSPTDRLSRVASDANLKGLILDLISGLTPDLIAAIRRFEPLELLVDSTEAAAGLVQPAIKDTLHRLWCVDPHAGMSDCNGPTMTDRSAMSAPLAYIIYTSGSTGDPKGVAITHESACRCIEKLHCMLNTSAQDRFTQFSAMSFDVSIADLFLCWKSGGSLCVPSQAESLVPLNFALRHKVTVWSSVPSIANFLLKLQLLKPGSLPDLRLTLFAGEALPVELARVWSEAAPRSRLFNFYGPTECTIFATCHEYQPHCGADHGVVPIGAPLPQLRCRVVDGERTVTSEDTPGELWIAGDQLASGYWNNAAATATAFVHLQDCAEVWYRTGDLVSYRNGVGLLFRGRLDRQIKLRGFRVELQEIESVLRDVMATPMVAVIPVRNPGGMCEKLVAYCHDPNVDEAAVKRRCLDRVPSYMVPERIYHVDPFPVSQHGKVDYAALAARPLAV